MASVGCNGCETEFAYNDGVLDLSTPNAEIKTKNDLTVYDFFWASTALNGILAHSETEAEVCRIATSGIDGATLLDIGCGDGRHIPMFNGLGIKQIICVESSSSIYGISKHFGNNYNGTAILYVKCDVAQLNVLPGCVNLVWALGIVNFFEKPEDLICRLMKASDHVIVFGLVSENKWGKLYAMLNFIRFFQNNKIIRTSLIVTSYGVSVSVIFMARCYNKVFAHKVPILARVLSQPNPIRAVQLSLLEPFISPKIYRHPIKIYDQIAKLKGFHKEYIKENFLTDLHYWKRISKN